MAPVPANKRIILIPIDDSEVMLDRCSADCSALAAHYSKIRMLQRRVPWKLDTLTEDGSRRTLTKPFTGLWSTCTEAEMTCCTSFM